MTEFILKIKNSAAVVGIKNFLSSDYFPFVTAALTLISYYLGLDVFLIAYIGVTCGLIFLLLDDVSPVLTIFLFMGAMLSMQNSPSTVRGNSDYFFKPEIYIPIIFVVTFLSGSVIYRLVNTCIKGKFKLTPVFFGLCALSVAFLLNGAAQKDYDIKNLMFSAMMTVFFLGIFAVVKDNIIINKKLYEKIALAFAAFSILLIVELAVVYGVNDGVIVNGEVNRNKIIFGWGVYTYYGVLAGMCVPAVTYLAGVKKHGYVYTVLSILTIAACIFSCSRQAYLCMALIYPVCLVLLLWKGQNRKINAVILGVSAIIITVIIGIYNEKIFASLKKLFENFVIDGEIYGSGRAALWRGAIKDFIAAPIFGAGFYGGNANSILTGFQFIPNMCHNTVLEMLSSCGIIGLAAYCVHRVQTVISYFKNITLERTMLALVIIVILFMSLFDMHIFNIFPTMVYSFLVSVLVKSEKKNSDAQTAQTVQE